MATKPALTYKGASQRPQAERAPPEGAKRAHAQAARAPSAGAHGPCCMGAASCAPKRGAPEVGLRSPGKIATPTTPKGVGPDPRAASTAVNDPEADRWWWLAASPMRKRRKPPPPQWAPRRGAPLPQLWSAEISAIQTSKAAISTMSHAHTALWGPKRRLQSPPRPIAAPPAQEGAGRALVVSEAPPARSATTWTGAAAGTGPRGSGPHGIKAARAPPRGATRATATSPPRVPKRPLSSKAEGAMVDMIGAPRRGAIKSPRHAPRCNVGGVIGGQFCLDTP
jgi:hypothetical protein